MKLELFEDTTKEYIKLMKQLLAQPSHSFGNTFSESIPRANGVYVIFDTELNQNIYVGRSRNSGADC